MFGQIKLLIMKPDLQALVSHWSNQSFMHELRSVTQQGSPGVHGELLLTLRVEMAVMVGKSTETVKCAKLYHTYENNNSIETSRGDCYRFDRQCTELDKEFGDAYEALLDKMIKEQYGDGFANPI